MRTEDPAPKFFHIVDMLAKHYPHLGYLHIVEPRVVGATDRQLTESESNDFARNIWPGPLISAGGYNRSQSVSGHGDCRHASQRADRI
jgi:NADPH2 dehydrogenase